MQRPGEIKDAKEKIYARTGEMLPGRVLEEDERLAAATRNLVELSGNWKEERDFFWNTKPDRATKNCFWLYYAKSFVWKWNSEISISLKKPTPSLGRRAAG